MPPPGNEKANPNIALNEATAMEQWQALGLGPNYVPYLSKDVYGNEITEPDHSNPTRSRHERPLDTIRSFEAAALGKEYTVGSAGSEAGLSRVESRRSVNYSDNRRVNRNSSYSGMSAMQRNYSYGNMQDQEYVEDGQSDMMPSSSGPSRHVSVSANAREQPSHASYDQRGYGYGSPVSESGRAQYTAPPPQKLNYQTPPTPPQEYSKAVPAGQEKKSWSKRLSFGKNK